MEELNGNAFIWTDQHIGLKHGSKQRLMIIANVFKQVIQQIKKNNVKHCFMLGDLFHTRQSVDVNVLNIGYKLVTMLAQHCDVWLLIGNHDTYYKNTIDVNSINIFKDNKKIHIIDKPTDILLNKQKCLLVPWLGNIIDAPNDYDIMMGHFDVSSKWLIANYKEEHSNQTITSDVVMEKIEDSLNNDDKPLKASKNNDKIGDFIEHVKQYGVIYSGHIHKNKEFISKTRTFIFVGSPYEQTLGDIGNKCGGYLLNDSNSRKFIEITNIPKHINIKMSDIINEGLENYDFSKVKGNIIHRIYDCEVDRLIESKITQAILDQKPYEELIPDYDINVTYDDSNLNTNSINIIKKSKLEYIKNYIDNINDQVLIDSGIERNKLYSLLEGYYNKVIEEK